MSVNFVRDEAWLETRGLITAFRFTASKANKNNVKNRIFREVVQPLALEIQAVARASGDKQSRIAADSVRARNLAKPTLEGGAGGGLPATLFYGAEFGGQRKGPIRTARISKKNPPFVVRQTTQQFREWREQQGYWFHPTLRRRTDWAIRGIWKIVYDELQLDELDVAA